MTHIYISERYALYRTKLAQFCCLGNSTNIPYMGAHSIGSSSQHDGIFSSHCSEFVQKNPCNTGTRIYILNESHGFSLEDLRCDSLE